MPGRRSTNNLRRGMNNKKAIVNEGTKFRYWRLIGMGSGTSFIIVSEWQLRLSAGNSLVLGTQGSIVSNDNSTDPFNAIDGNLGSYWQGSGTGLANKTLTFTTTDPAGKHFVQMSLQNPPSATTISQRTVRNFTLQVSTNNVDWIEMLVVSGQPAWNVAGETRVYDLPDY